MERERERFRNTQQLLTPVGMFTPAATRPRILTSALDFEPCSPHQCL